MFIFGCKSSIKNSWIITNPPNRLYQQNPQIKSELQFERLNFLNML